MPKYDYIIAGAGCAGLSLLYYIITEPELSQKKILVIDQNLEKANDRTWCFWETSEGAFEQIVTKQWDRISIHNGEANYELPTAPFTYKMIEGIHFYNYILTAAKQFSNIEWFETAVLDMKVQDNVATVQWSGGSATADYVFTSIVMPTKQNTAITSQSKAPFLWQHFKGMVVEFETPLFDDTIAKLMDFNVDQKGDTAFMYVLPLSHTKALVEYTLFSPQCIDESAYDQQLQAYLTKQYPHSAYTVLHTEQGAIPMTTSTFSNIEAPIYAIGTMGNAVKASTGYAFTNIQDQVKNIVEALVNKKKINTKINTRRHQFYDAVLLYILFHHKMKGAEIFTRIFAKNNAATVFKFLSNRSNLIEDIQIMRTLPTRIFLPAALQHMASSYNG